MFQIVDSDRFSNINFKFLLKTSGVLFGFIIIILVWIFLILQSS
jgi:hypothetical protein